MEKSELMAIGMYAEMLRLQPNPSLALIPEQRRELRDLLLKWCRENRIEIPLGARPGDVLGHAMKYRLRWEVENWVEADSELEARDMFCKGIRLNLFGPCTQDFELLDTELLPGREPPVPESSTRQALANAFGGYSFVAGPGLRFRLPLLWPWSRRQKN